MLFWKVIKAWSRQSNQHVSSGLAERVFQVYMESIRSGKNDTFVPEHLMIKDPYRIEEQVHFKKKQQGLVDVEFKAWNLVLTGLHNLRIANLHVVRHMNLKDIRLLIKQECENWTKTDLFHRIVAQIVTDIGFTGEYQLQGSGLSVVNLSGRKILHKNE